MNNSPSLGGKIKQAREDQGWSQQNLADAIGFSKAAVNHWENSRSEPSFDTVEKLAKVLGKPITYFLNGPGLTEVRDTIIQEVRKDMAGFVGVRILPVVGRVAAGKPILAEENIDEYIPVPEEFAAQADFLLRVQGDSMVDAGIHDGDYVLIRRADEAKPGDIVVALIGEDATLKFLRYKDHRYYLEAANPGYTSIPVNDDVHIQGVYVALFTRRGLAVPPPEEKRPGTSYAAPTLESLREELAKREGINLEALEGAIAALKAMRGKHS